MITCPSCGTENPEGARFCNACGSPLASAEPLRKERKFATALFADLVGSTTLAEQEDPWTLRSDSLIASADQSLHRELLDMVRATAGNLE